MKQMFLKFHFYCLQRSWGKVIFSEACVKNSVYIGHAWQGACMAGVACVAGYCMAGGACIPGGMHGMHTPPADTMRYGQ